MSEKDNIQPDGLPDSSNAANTVRNALDSTPGRLRDEQLMAYLEGTLDAAGQHAAEQWLAAAGMESDAIDGLRSLPPREIKQSVSRLNQALVKAVKEKKKRRGGIDMQRITITAVFIILLLAAIAFVIIKMGRK